MRNKIIGIIPARYNSTRFLGKLLYKIGSKTLLQHTYDNAKSCLLLDKLYIATEDEIIKTHAHSIQANCIMTNKCANGTHRIIEALKNTADLQNSDIIVNIQGDHPKVAVNTIIQTVNLLINDKTAAASTALTKVSYDIASCFHHVKCVFDNSQNALYFSRSLIPYSKNPKDISYYYHIGLYAYRTSFLYELDGLRDTFLQNMEDLEQLKILEYGYKLKVAVVNDMPLGVDVFEDVKKAQKILCQ